MTDKLCFACGLGPTKEVYEDYTSFGKLYHNQVHSACDHCGCTTVSGAQHDHNCQQAVSEICGPFRPIEISGIHHASAYFDWSWHKRGFGQLSFSYNRETGKITCMNECMSRESVRQLLRAFADHIADNCELDDE